MLQHEQTDPPPVSPPIPLPVPAANARVTPDELNAALKALEDQQSSTVAIGSVVDELHLNATPEQIWGQVQKQREQKQQMPPSRPQVFQPQRKPKWGAIIALTLGVVFALPALLGILAGSSSTETTAGTSHKTTAGAAHSKQITQPHAPAAAVTHPGQTVTIGGDGQDETIPVEGKDVVITGSDNDITLQGQARSVTIGGDGNDLQGDSPAESSVSGNGNNIQWTSTP